MTLSLERTTVKINSTQKAVMKNLGMLGFGLAAALLPFKGTAATFTDVDSFAAIVGNDIVYPTVDSTNPFTIDFNVISAVGDTDLGLDVRGYTPGTAVDAVATFTFQDEGTAISRTAHIDFDLTASFDKTWIFGGGLIFSTVGEPVAANLLTLAQDGVVSVVISTTSSRFQVESARLDITTRVPEACSSLAFMGLAMGGLALAGRRFSLSR